MAIIPETPVLQPKSNIVGLDEARWANGWPATTIADPRSVRSLQDSEYKGGCFRNGYQNLFENLDLINDFYGNDIIVVAMNRGEQMFPPWLPTNTVSWGAYPGMILRTIIVDRPENPAPGVLPPTCIKSNLEAWHYRQDQYFIKLVNKTYVDNSKPVNTGITEGGKTCPILVPWGDPWGSHDAWRIYALNYDVSYDLFFEQGLLPTREGAWTENLGSEFWGNQIFANSFSVVASGPIENGRLSGVPEYATAPFPTSLDTPDTTGRSIAGGWLLTTGNAEKWYLWENKGWTPGERMLDRNAEFALYFCDV